MAIHIQPLSGLMRFHTPYLCNWGVKIKSFKEIRFFEKIGFLSWNKNIVKNKPLSLLKMSQPSLQPCPAKINVMDKIAITAKPYPTLALTPSYHILLVIIRAFEWLDDRHIGAFEWLVDRPFSF